MKILCVGGGTLGSVTPLLALVEELRARHAGWQFEWWGTYDGPEGELVRASGVPFRSVSAGKLRRYADMRIVADTVKVAGGLAQALWRFGLGRRPDVVLTAGSYVAVPVAYAAAAYGVPVFIHQQDVRIGLANRLMAPVAKQATVTFERSKEYFRTAVLTGNPVRRAFLSPPDTAQARLAFGLDPAAPTVTVIGGGTGAAALNELARHLPDLVPSVQVLHIAGRGKTVPPAGGRYRQLEFTTDSVGALAAADVVVTRAGMGVLTELAALKKPCIVVPIRESHQEENASAVREADAGVVLPETGLTALKLAGTVSELMNDATRRIGLGERLARLLHTEAAAGRIAGLVEEVLGATK